jgi:hypothetical protein
VPAGQRPRADADERAPRQRLHAKLTFT